MSRQDGGAFWVKGARTGTDRWFRVATWVLLAASLVVALVLVWSWGVFALLPAAFALTQIPAPGLSGAIARRHALARCQRAVSWLSSGYAQLLIRRPRTVSIAVYA